MSMHRHYSYYWHRCRDCGRPADTARDLTWYCEDCLAAIEAAEEATAEAAEADAIPNAFPCTCRWPYVPSNALEPPEPILDRYCPIHGDGGPDPDRAYEERRDYLMTLDRFPHDNED